MINKKLSEITIEDLRHLVENNVIEKKTLEYKIQLPDNSDFAKKEFLADVSSFANTTGGDLIFGIGEKGGKLDSEVGFQLDNPDAEISRLENIIRDGIMPRISIDLKVVDAENAKKAIIARMKADLEVPHRVVFKGHDKFYRRNSNGKYPMDVDELKAAFIQAGSLPERIRNFRKLRILDIKSGETPLPILSNSFFTAIHILPLSAFNTSFKVSSATLLAVKEGKHSKLFSPLYCMGWSHRINLDGVIAFSSAGDKPVVRTYVQLYRNGNVEAVDSNLLPRKEETERNVLPMYSIEDEIMKYAEKTMKFLTEIEVQPPYYIFLSLIGVNEFTIATPSRMSHLETNPITIDDLILPEIVIEDVNDNIQHKFRPIFDIIWNAGGISKSLNFDDNNNFL